MLMEKAIIVENIFKKYTLYNDTRERLLDLITPKDYGEDFYALTDVSFQAEKGDVVGFIGINGSGKSTLSNIIAGIVPETSGHVKVNGETSLIAVAAGLKGDLTGRDNIELKCLMLGFTKEEIKEMEPAIIEFSELGDFIDQPVKSYSSGMRSRLGFAISVNVNPEILIIDEALSVGDKAFAEKSLNKMNEFKEQGKTMIFVSHSIGQMKKFCQKILWLEFGRVKEFGTVDEVMPKYEKFLTEWQKMSREEREVYKNYSMTQDEIGLKSLIDVEKVEEQEEEEAEEVYVEESVSRIAHFKAKATDLYQDPQNLKDTSPVKPYKHSPYYIKKQAHFYKKKFFLLSTIPSAVEGVIGWAKASDMKSHLHLFIDGDPKTFILKGKGYGYNRPWGGRKNIVYDDLEPYKGYTFHVSLTEKIGKNLWYFGTLDGVETWIHANHIEEVEDMEEVKGAESVEGFEE